LRKKWYDSPATAAPQSRFARPGVAVAQPPSSTATQSGKAWFRMGWSWPGQRPPGPASRRMEDSASALRAAAADFRTGGAL
jgi:hypothetical protein